LESKRGFVFTHNSPQTTLASSSLCADDRVCHS